MRLVLNGFAMRMVFGIDVVVASEIGQMIIEKKNIRLVLLSHVNQVTSTTYFEYDCESIWERCRVRARVRQREWEWAIDIEEYVVA